jgi:hypothetical protein
LMQQEIVSWPYSRLNREKPATTLSRQLFRA